MNVMIIGIGNDLIEKHRVHKIISNSRIFEFFLKRIFTPQELLLLQKLETPASYIANRFCAKEACAKALGTGIGAKLSFQDMEIHKHQSGQPYVKLMHRIYTKFQFNKSEIIPHLTLTDTKEYSFATVIIEKRT